MRKLLILLFLVMCTCLKAQVSTNKIQNMATMMLSNSTLFVGSTNATFNGTKYVVGDVVRIYGIDSVVSLLPSTPLHDRVTLAWFTNDNLVNAANSWLLGPDIAAGSFHTFDIADSFNSRVPFTINSNQNIFLNIPFVIASSNLVVSNTVTTVSTNDARFYMVNGIPGFTGSITNIGPELGFSNVHVYASGIVTNYFKIP